LESSAVGVIIIRALAGRTMFGKKNVGLFSGICLGTVAVGLFGVIFSGFLRSLNVVLAVLLVMGLWIGFYFAGVWATTDRSDELDRKFPISSSELRKRKKDFYDWLASQGRR